MSEMLLFAEGMGSLVAATAKWTEGAAEERERG